MVALTLIALASATVSYVCDCGPGADGDCVPGNDKAAGSDPSTPWQSVEKARLAWSGAYAGDQVLFCAGGVFDLPEINRWVASGCAAATPCVIGAYTPSWASGDEPRPLLVQTYNSPGIRFDEGKSATHQEGVRIEGLNLTCKGCTDDGGRGIVLADDIDDVTIAQVGIDHFDVGIEIGNGVNCAAGNPTCDRRNDRITITGATLHDNLSYGVSASGNNLTIQASTFRNNGVNFATDHNLYINAAQSPDSSIVVSGNDLSGAVPVGGDSCHGAELQVEGLHNALMIVGNTISETGGPVDDDCAGISVSSGLTGLAEGFGGAVIKNNIIHNVGAIGIGVSSCDTCTIENNLLTWDASEAGASVVAISAPDRQRGAEDSPLHALNVRNNTVSIDSGGTGIRIDTEGTDHIIVSNAIIYTGNGNDWNCLDANLPTSSYVEIDYDLCWFPDAHGEWNDTWGTNPDPLSAWSAVSGFGNNCLTADPELDSTLAPVDESSTVVGKGHPTRSSVDDITGRTRFDPDIGAYEWGLPLDTGDSGDTGTTDTGYYHYDTGTPHYDTGPAAGPQDTGTEEKKGVCGCGYAPNAPLSLAWIALSLGLVASRRR